MPAGLIELMTRGGLGPCMPFTNFTRLQAPSPRSATTAVPNCASARAEIRGSRLLFQRLQNDLCQIIGPAAELVPCWEKPGFENAGLEFESRPKNWGHCSESSLPRRCESRILHRTAI